MLAEGKSRQPSVSICLDAFRAGGTERQSVWLARALAAKGWEVRLCLLSGGIRSGSAKPSELGELAIETVSIFSEIFRRRGPDVILCMGRTANSLGWIFKRLHRRSKLITTCRTNRALPLGYRMSLKRSDLCITNSKWAAREVQLITGFAECCLVSIPNALFRPELLSLDLAEEAKRLAKVRLGIEPDAVVLSNVSSFLPGKNKQDLLRAFAATDSFAAGAVLLLAGSGKEEGACKALASELGIEGQVRFLGLLDSVNELLQATDIFVSTSLRDSMPNAVVEAQAAGLPVIAYDTAGVGETFEPDQSGLLIDAGDIKCFANAIDSLAASKGTRCDYAEEARARAARLYAPELIAGRYDTVLRDLL